MQGKQLFRNREAAKGDERDIQRDLGEDNMDAPYPRRTWAGFLPIDSFVIVGAIKKLDLLEGGWTWEVTGDSWMHGQEEVHSCCTCNRNQLTGPGSHIMLWLNERLYLHCKKQFPDGPIFSSPVWLTSNSHRLQQQWHQALLHQVQSAFQLIQLIWIASLAWMLPPTSATPMLVALSCGRTQTCHERWPGQGMC